MKRLQRLIPRTAAGQLIAVAMLTLVVSQIVLTAIMLDEREHAMRGWWANDTLNRIASLVELLDATPDELHTKVINASDSQLLICEIAETQTTLPAVDETLSYLRELRAMIPKDPSKVLVRLGDQQSWYNLLGRWIEQWWRTSPPLDEPWLEASVQLTDGKWLNLEVGRDISPPPVGLLFIPVIIILLVFGSTLIIIIRHITQPMNGLAQAAEALGRGENVGPITARGPREIRQAIVAFNDMRERLSRSVLDRTRMLAAVGHDLRTPITHMRLRAEFIDDDETRGRILSCLDEMQHMAEAALAFAREEAVVEATRMVDLNALVGTVCADQADMSRDVAYEEFGRLPYRCRPHSLTRAVRNLVENAIVHGRSARVHMNGPDEEVWITIEDDGPGIPDLDMGRVFQPFVRLDESRGQETGSIGLGLAIARSIVRGHGGDILLQNRAEGGLAATIQLPRRSEGYSDDAGPRQMDA
jgi:signal transduction histidine kinase